MNVFFSKLKSWYKLNARDLPWRKTKDPYYVWISEVVLQQTRVNQGLNYYFNFIHTFPTITALAEADESEVLKAWQGLGYYSRARNMLKAARQVIEIHGDNFPADYASLIVLPGIGDYTAAAISSVVTNERRPALDGNVSRVISRLYEISEPINSGRFNRIAKECLLELMPEKESGNFNQGMIELGAMVCVPQKPLCSLCPVSDHCNAFLHGTIQQFPQKISKKKPMNRYFHYLVLLHKDSTWLQQRIKGIWKGLYEFPMVEVEENDSAHDPVSLFAAIATLDGNVLLKETIDFKHQLTHQTIYARFWVFQSKSTIIVSEKEAEKVSLEALDKYPVHKLMLKFISSCSLFKT